YLVQSDPDRSGAWNDVMLFVHDDPIPIPHENVRNLNDRVAFVFIGWQYAVSADGGHSWTVWTATKDLPNWHCCNYRLIEDVQLGEDGSGCMKLRVIDANRGEVPEL